MRRPARALGAVLLAAGLVGLAAAAASAEEEDSTVAVDVTIPDASAGVAVIDAQLRWGLSTEAGGAAFNGECNFLSAGAVGDTGGGGVWTEADGFFHASAGNVTIQRPTADGGVVPASFTTRCLGPDGAPLTTANLVGSGAEVVIDGGVGTVDRAAGTASIRWSGSFTVVFYGGLTYWWATDPVLVVEADGTGTLTATVSGYGTSMADLTRWDPLPPTTVVLADLRGVSLADRTGFSVVPEYLGVAVAGPGIDQVPRTTANADHWGSFPQSFVEFQVRTGQAGYWYTSGGGRDPAKAPTRLYVSYDASRPVVREDDPVAGPGGGGIGVANPLVPRPAPGPEPVWAMVPGAGVAPANGEPVSEATASAPATVTVLPESALIPSGPGGPAGTRAEQVLWALSGVMALGCFAVLGFRRGWLVWPWAR